MDLKNCYGKCQNFGLRESRSALSNAAPSVSTLFEPIININSNFKTKTF
jgi:hypothetical protein